jgi:hypothetical protein
MRVIKLTEDEVGILFQAIFNEVTEMEKSIENAKTDTFRDSMKARLAVMETISKKVMHGRRLDVMETAKTILADDTPY